MVSFKLRFASHDSSSQSANHNIQASFKRKSNKQWARDYNRSHAFHQKRGQQTVTPEPAPTKTITTTVHSTPLQTTGPQDTLSQLPSIVTRSKSKQSEKETLRSSSPLNPNAEAFVLESPIAVEPSLCTTGELGLSSTFLIGR